MPKISIMRLPIWIGSYFLRLRIGLPIWIGPYFFSVNLELNWLSRKTFLYLTLNTSVIEVQ